MVTREALHRLVDELSATVLADAERALGALHAPQADPFLQLLMSVPEDDESLTAENIAAIEEGEAEIARGEGTSWHVVRNELGRST